MSWIIGFVIYMILIILICRAMGINNLEEN